MNFSDWYISPNTSIWTAQINWHLKVWYKDQMQPQSESKSGKKGEQTVKICYLLLAEGETNV